MSVSIDGEFGFMQTALGLRAQRQELLASNIANADTPDYKARDFDFASELTQAVKGQGGQLALARTNAGHLGAGAGYGVKALYRADTQGSIDGNTVNMDVERAQFTGNAIHYQFVADRISGKVRDLLLAVKGQ
jgi:flagellar basal-body rod protein FlgB